MGRKGKCQGISFPVSDIHLLAMGKTQFECGRRHEAASIVKHIAAQNGNQLVFVQHFGIPRQRRAGDQHRPAYGQRLWMPAIAPVGDKITPRAKFFSRLGGGPQVGKRIVMPADQCLPGRSAGTDVKGDLRLRELRGFFFKRMIRFIAPVQGDDARSAGLRRRRAFLSAPDISV